MKKKILNVSFTEIFGIFIGLLYFITHRMDKKGHWRHIFFCASILFLFTLLAPKISSSLYPFVRFQLLNRFLTNTVKNKTINAKEFWQFRDFYYPGSIRFNKMGLTDFDYTSFTRDIPIILTKKIAPVLYFHSNLIESYETLGTVNGPSVFSMRPNDEWRIIFQGKNEMIGESDKAILITFIKPIAEMEKANGYFDYKDKDKKLLENKNWVVITKINK